MRLSIHKQIERFLTDVFDFTLTEQHYGMLLKEELQMADWERLVLANRAEEQLNIKVNDQVLQQARTLGELITFMIPSYKFSYRV